MHILVLFLASRLFQRTLLKFRLFSCSKQLAMFKRIIPAFLLMLVTISASASELLIPMDLTQSNHLKAYGIAYYVLKQGLKVDWLLNYRGGSFAMPMASGLESECKIRGVSYEVLADGQYNAILTDIANPETNMDVMKLEKAPKIAVYKPKTKKPWDDAVTLVLTYAEIPYDQVYDDEVLD